MFPVFKSPLILFALSVGSSPTLHSAQIGYWQPVTDYPGMASSADIANCHDFTEVSGDFFFAAEAQFQGDHSVLGSSSEPGFFHVNAAQDYDSSGSIEDNCPATKERAQSSTNSTALSDSCNQPSSIRITSPVNGESIDSSTVSLIGSVQAPFGGIVLADYNEACLLGNVFLVNNVHLKEGNQEVSAFLIPPGRHPVSARVDITKTGNSLYEVEPLSTCSLSDEAIGFTFTYIDPAVKEIHIDFDDDKVTDATLTDFPDPESLQAILPEPQISHTFTRPGIHRVRTHAFQSDGKLRSQITYIGIVDRNRVDAEIRSVWQDVMTGMISRNLALSLGSMTPQAQEIYAPVFQALGADLPTIAKSYSPLQEIDLGLQIASYSVNRMINGEKHLYVINFMKDSKGIWKLHSM